MRAYGKASFGVASAVAFASLAHAQNVPVERNDVLLGLSRFTAAESIMQIRGFPTGAATASVWDIPFIQGLEFDNTDGFRHAEFGNLLGVNFGTSGAGGSIFQIQTNGAATPSSGTQLFAFTAGDPTLSRLGGLSVSPDNTKVAFTGNDQGHVYVMDYNAGPSPGSGTGASLSNLRSVVAVGTGSTIATTWLDNSNVLALDRTGNLQQVDVSGVTPTASTVKTLTFNIGGGNPFTNVVYEPTLSPYVYATHGTFDTGTSTTVNEIFILDPANNFDQVGAARVYSTSSQTFREMAFDSRGNLFFAQFGSGTITPSIDYVANAAADPTNLADNNSVDYYTVPAGITASFSGLDIASRLLDYKTPGVTVNVRSRQHVQYYLANQTTADVLAEVRGKVQAGYNGGAWNGVGILSSDANANQFAVGYGDAAALGLIGQTFGGETVAANAILFRLTRYGDANLDGTVNLTDFNRLAGAFGTSNRFWQDGDFNYDGTVNLSDFNLLAGNFGLSAGPDGPTAADWAALAAAIPEPAGLGLFAAATIVASARRRR